MTVRRWKVIWCPVLLCGGSGPRRVLARKTKRGWVLEDLPRGWKA